MSPVLPLSAAVYVAGFLAALAVSPLRRRWRILALAILAAAGLTALVYVDIALYRRASSMWNTPSEVISSSRRLWLWSTIFILGGLYSLLRSARTERRRRIRRFLCAAGALALTSSVLVLLASGAVRIAGTRMAPRENVAVSVQPDYVALLAIRSDGGIGLQSPYFDVAHERVRITIEAAAATIVELKDSRLARVDLSAAAKPKIVVAHGGRERAIRAIDDVAAARRISVKQRVTLESLHVSLQERDTGVPAPAGASAQRETSHAVLLASSPIPAFLDPGGVPAKKTGSFSAFEKRWDPSTLTSLLVSFRDNPVWTSFGMQWSSTLESETRELLGRSDRGVFILPAADLTQGEHGGRLRLALRAPTDFMLVLDEAHVFSGLTETLTGLVVIFVKGATVTEVQPLRPEPSSPVIFMRWAVATETLDDSHSREESAVSVLYAGNARGRVSVGQNERPLDSDVNTIALASGETYPDVRVRWAANRLYASCSAGTVERITLNGTSLLPTIWESLSNEARIGVAGGLATFLIGLLLANKSDVRRLWHWATGTLD